jgi:DinB superfamily
MYKSVNKTLWSQFSASIEMLENAIMLCPAEQWNTGTRFWYNAYHCLFFLDYYLTMDPKTFSPPAPFTLSEFEDTMPERVYEKQELINYLQYNREKGRQLISGLTEEKLFGRWINVSGSMNYTVFEILLYNMRHVQHHAAQLNLLLRQSINDAPDWVSQGRGDV